MTPEDLYDIDVSNLSNLDVKTKQEVINTGKTLYLKSVDDLSKLLELEFLDLLKSSVYNTEKEINRQSDIENYELCYFLNEILKEIKTEYNGLLL